MLSFPSLLSNNESSADRLSLSFPPNVLILYLALLDFFLPPSFHSLHLHPLNVNKAAKISNIVPNFISSVRLSVHFFPMTVSNSMSPQYVTPCSCIEHLTLSLVPPSTFLSLALLHNLAHLPAPISFSATYLASCSRIVICLATRL